MKHTLKYRNRFLVFAVLCFLFVITAAFAVHADDKEVIIIYTNDIHTYINNTVKDSEGNESRGLSYASVAALKKELESQGKNVLLVDAGDHSQGTAYGGMDEGKAIIQMMNAAGYQLTTLGNHEFDYGMFRTFQIIDEADFPYISCNFYDAKTKETVLEAYKVFEIGGLKIGFIGISTPESITKSTPVYFQDTDGSFLYNFYAGEGGKDLYEAVQKAIDELRPQTDYIIALGHLGSDLTAKPYRSIDVISNTSGLTAFIDGHSHTVMEAEQVEDKDGNNVLLTQTGCYFASIGEMIIGSDGSVSTRLINEYDGLDEEVDKIQQECIGRVAEVLEEKIAVNEINLTINDPADNSRMVRRAECNLGDFNADAFYYYFNDVLKEPCDLVLQNGGGVRADLPVGDVSYLSAQTVNPFGNVACMVLIKGQDILDALEKCAKDTGIIDEETGKYAENGGFLQVAGLKYDIDTSIESSVTVDENDVWVSGPDKEYRVKNVQVYNRETKKYDDLDLERSYRVAGLNYILRNQGNGLTMLSDTDLIIDYVSEDYLILSEYIRAFEKGDDGFAHITGKSAPLSSYEGYLLDYDNPYGSGRITIY